MPMQNIDQNDFTHSTITKQATAHKPAPVIINCAYNNTLEAMMSWIKFVKPTGHVMHR